MSGLVGNSRRHVFSWRGSVILLLELVFLRYFSLLTLGVHFPYTVHYIIWAESSEFVSSSIPSWQIVTAHAQPFRGARDLAFRLKVPLDSLLVWASSGGSGETARMRRLAWTFAARIGDKYQIRIARPISLLTVYPDAPKCQWRDTMIKEEWEYWMDEWIDELGSYVPFSSFSVISGWWVNMKDSVQWSAV